MVPQTERERLENLFKGASDAVNCLVCTPTLELGIDIGQLDSVLMRNVPPLPANYWQRAGRAGRRHRMAVDITYCRSVSHDRAYFADPLEVLSGRIDPPAFNLRNEAMVAKHVHATVITGLHRYARDRGRTEAERDEIRGVLARCLPSRVSPYLFEDSAPGGSSPGSAPGAGSPGSARSASSPSSAARYASSPGSSARSANSLGSGEFGYPVCTVCGQSVSPLSSERQREEFRAAHRATESTSGCASRQPSTMSGRRCARPSRPGARGTSGAYSRRRKSPKLSKPSPGSVARAPVRHAYR